MIEQQLERIAVALEAIARNTTKTDAQPGLPPLPPVAVVKEKKAPKGAPVIEPEIVDPFATEETAVDVVTIEMLTEVLREHAKALGTPSAIALIKKHGADATTPKITSIPTANFEACYAEAKKDLAKVSKKG